MEINLETVSLALEAMALASGAVLAAFWIGLVVWTVQDIRLRSRDVFAWILSGLLVLLFNLLGLALYLLMRPKETLAEQYERALEEEVLLQGLESRATCPHCQKPVEADFLLCPWCHTELKKRCPGCQRALELEWSVCPYCGHPQPAPVGEPAAAPEVTEVAQPAAVLAETDAQESEPSPEEE
jgi:RNA polymerase subunit RPABC4/transcription elongation factor Spt4